MKDPEYRFYNPSSAQNLYYPSNILQAEMLKQNNMSAAAAGAPTMSACQLEEEMNGKGGAGLGNGSFGDVFLVRHKTAQSN